MRQDGIVSFIRKDFFFFTSREKLVKIVNFPRLKQIPKWRLMVRSVENITND